ncbi:MAG TPA: type I polyketide synthase, partial [Mycobacterium sp.]|nr:type I polyketide synthase [Mycobacterium sp.]
HSIPTLQRDVPDTLTFRTNLNATHTMHPPRTDHPPEPHPVLPCTPWHHSRHWFAAPQRRAGAGRAPRAGTLLGPRLTVSSTPPAHLWQARLAPEAMPYPGGHRIQGADMVPASVLLHTILTAAAESGAQAVSAVRFEYPIVVDRPRDIQVVAGVESLTLSSAAPDTGADRWVRHVSARLSAPSPDTEPSHAGAPQAGAPQSVPSIEQHLSAWGIEGQPFRWSVSSCRSKTTGMVVGVDMPEPSTVALLDAGLHLARLVDLTDSRLMLPAAAEQVRLGTALTTTGGAVAIRRRSGGDGELIVDVSGTVPDGTECFSIRGLRYVALDAGPGADSDPRRFAHTVAWQPWVPEGDGHQTPRGSVALIGAGAPERLQKGFADAGFPVGGQGDARFVLYLAGPEPATADETDLDYAARVSAEVTRLLRELAARGDHGQVSLWIVTRGVHEAAGEAAPRQGCLWGLAGVIAAEQPDLWGGLVDLPLGGDAGEHASALAGVLAATPTSVLTLKDGEFCAPVLAPLSGEPVRPPLRCRPDAAYLVTGGMGALGLLMAAWLAERGARRLILAGRTALPPRRDWDTVADPALRAKIAAIRSLESRGVSVEAVALDVGSSEAVQALVARRDGDGAPPIRGVIHAAGVTDSRLLADTTEAALRHVMWPKIAGAQALHRAFPPASLDFFVLTASAATVFGVPGQGSYAAANAYLDALARVRHRQGCHTLSLDWVAWQGLGFAADAAIVTDELARMGSRPLTPEEAFTAWEHVDRYDVARAVIVPLPPTAGRPAARPHPSSPRRPWAQLPRERLLSELQSGLRAILAAELQMSEAELDLDRPFAELGLNSVTAMSIRRQAEDFVGIELSATMMWNHPTIVSLAAYLAKKLVPDESPGGDEPHALFEAGTGGVLDTLFDSIESARSEQ